MNNKIKLVKFEICDNINNNIKSYECIHNIKTTDEIVEVGIQNKKYYLYMDSCKYCCVHGVLKTNECIKCNN